MKKIFFSLPLFVIPFLIFGAVFLYHGVLSYADQSQSGGNSCASKQRGINNNNNCNQQNQGQSQDQTQNNNQNVNISLSQTQNAQLAVAPVARSLPSTGTPLEVWELLGSFAPLGIFLRKLSGRK